MRLQEPIAADATSDVRRLAASTVVTHAVALAAVVYELAATGVPLLIVLALMLLVTVAAAGLLLWRLASAPSTLKSADTYFWSYGAGTLLFVCAAGAAIAVLALVAPPEAPLHVTKLVVPGLVALAMFDLYQALEAARNNDRAAQTRLASDDPVRASLIVMLSTSATATLATAAALVLAGEFAINGATFAAGLVIVLALAAAAAHLGLELKQRLAGASAGDAVRRRLLVALDKAAMQSGAIRQINALETQYVGPAALRVILHIDFKDGVSAQHIAPVLDKLKRAAAAEVPEVTDVVLAPPSSL